MRTPLGPAGAASMQPYWRQRPRLFRGFLDAIETATYDPQRFLTWCRPPALGRIYVRRESEQSGSARAAPLADVRQAAGLYDYLRGRGESFTLLLNQVEQVDDTLPVLRARFGVGLAFRHDDIVATLSTASSGIGLHAGHEDGFIVQLHGSRCWQLWPKESMGQAYLRALLGDPAQPSAGPPARPIAPPLLRCALHPGDALYIPALMGHEGITLTDSLSLSIAWAGLSPYRLLRALVGPLSARIEARVQAAPQAFFCLLPDPPAGAAAAPILLESLLASFARLEEDAPPVEAVRQFVQGLVQGGVAPPHKEAAPDGSRR